MNGLKVQQKPKEIPQCQYFVQRKKRLCRMTVRPGKRYCGEHEPEPQNEAGEPDVRVPCPLDPKHTCYVSKLEKHLQICNARQAEQPEYIVLNINSSGNITNVPRKPLNQIPEKDLLKLIDKVNSLYEKLVEGHITPIPQQEIHSVVQEEFNEADRTESSRRHLRQASSLLRLMEDEGLVQDDTCYVELGAGKGQLSYYLCRAWCAPPSRSLALLVDRAALRHKRDNKLAGGVARLRADLAHLSLGRVAAAAGSARLVGVAKHLCGVAMDFALRCITAAGVLHKTRGIVLATCCHHRIERAAYVGTHHIQDLGIDAEELNIMLGIVSWATCGDGRSREQRNAENADTVRQSGGIQCASKHDAILETGSKDHTVKNTATLSQEYRESVGRRAKALLDWGRILYLRDKGFDARLCQYVPSSVSLENVCIVATKVS